MRGRARRWGAPCRVGVGWERRLSSAFALARRPVGPPPVSLFHPTSPPRSLEVGPEGWEGGCAQRTPTPPHAPSAVAAAMAAFPPAADRTARILRSRLAGCAALRLAAFRRVAACLPIASRRWREAPGAVCLGRSSVVRCSGPAARSPGASPRPPSLGASSQPLPRLSCLVLSHSHLCRVPGLVWFSRPLTSVVSLPAWRHASRRSPFPLPLVVSGMRARVGAPVVEGRGRGLGRLPYGCARWWGMWGWSTGVGGDLQAAVDQRTGGPHV